MMLEQPNERGPGPHCLVGEPEPLTPKQEALR